ncbi:MAG: GH92 family glycosyl hydrolase [Bacteroidota bacterium]
MGKIQYGRIRNVVYIFMILFLTVSCNEKEIVGPKMIKATEPVDLVYPLLDTENSRWFFFSSASRPFGMVNLSPDTQVKGSWGSGYRYKVDTIQGFSHIHAWQLSGLSVMPLTLSQGKEKSIFKDYKSKFSHGTERVSPGYHYVELDRYGVAVELTGTKRVGFHKYTFPENEHAAVLFNLNGILGPSRNTQGILKKVGDSALLGELQIGATHRRPKPVKLFFSVVLDAKIKTVTNDSETGNYLISLEKDGPEVLMKVGISYTSLENAVNNRETELPDWSFDNVVADSKDEWNILLKRIKVEGGTHTAQRRFYTDLWHALQGRRIISDVNGAYPDNSGDIFRIGQLPLDDRGMPRFNHYNSDSFWGAQWTLNTLWGLVYPDIMKEFAYSLLQYQKDGGLVPRGPSGGNYTYVMTGASSTPFIVSAIQKGLVTENHEQIYQVLKKNHMPGGIMEKAGYEHATSLGGGLRYYLKNGYVPYPIPEGKFGGHQEGAGLTLEYAYQDWALAQLAKKLGHKEDCRYFLDRSNNYRNVFDSISGWVRPKDVAGNWFADYDPYQHQHGFVESNGAQATWFVPHDIEGLSLLMGGRKEAVRKLDAQFKEASKLGFTSGTSHAQELHPEYSRIPINYGNQPSIQTAFVFNQLGRPDLAQYWSRSVVDRAFSGLSTNAGYNGDEDQGLMGSLAVLMKIGLFQMNGGTEEDPKYEFGSPIFDRVTIALNNGNVLRINALGAASGKRYLQAVRISGVETQQHYIKHSDLIKGASLDFTMGDTPVTVE